MRAVVTNQLRVFSVVVFLCLGLLPDAALAKRRLPPGGRLAVVADERLSALRASPELRQNYYAGWDVGVWSQSREISAAAMALFSTK